MTLGSIMICSGDSSFQLIFFFLLTDAALWAFIMVGPPFKRDRKGAAVTQTTAPAGC